MKQIETRSARSRLASVIYDSLIGLIHATDRTPAE